MSLSCFSSFSAASEVPDFHRQGSSTPNYKGGHRILGQKMDFYLRNERSREGMPKMPLPDVSIAQPLNTRWGKPLSLAFHKLHLEMAFATAIVIAECL